jgi:hypothetical protein
MLTQHSSVLSRWALSALLAGMSLTGCPTSTTGTSISGRGSTRQTITIATEIPAEPPQLIGVAGSEGLKQAVRLNPPELQADVVLSVEDMIRLVWPDDLEARALRIAYRESRYQCCVRTWCCYGVFQIHQAHLSRLGLDNVTQLYDPMTNVLAAYDLYLLDGWAPWSTG